MDAEQRSQSPFLLETKNTAATDHDDEQDETNSTFRDEGNDEEAPELLFKPVHADDPPAPTFWQKYRLVIWGATVIFLIVLVGVVVGVFVHSSLDNDKKNAGVLTDDYYTRATGEPSSQPDVFVPNDNGGSSTTTTTTTQAPPSTALLKSLEDTVELYVAVDEYLAAASSPHSLVAQTYGFPIHTWDVSRVTHLDYLFDVNRVGANATLVARFNEPLNDWDTSKVVSMAGTFQGAISFNQPLNKWNVAKVTNFELMFHKAHAFNGDISNWQTSSATNFWSMFDNAMSFNRDISNWPVGSVTSFHSMFYGAVKFRQSLCSWGLQMKRESYRSVVDMFTWADSCVTTQSPEMTWSPPGPFCFNCG